MRILVAEKNDCLAPYWRTKFPEHEFAFAKISMSEGNREITYMSGGFGPDLTFVYQFKGLTAAMVKYLRAGGSKVWWHWSDWHKNITPLMIAAADECDFRSLQSGYAAHWLFDIIGKECFQMFFGINPDLYYPESKEKDLLTWQQYDVSFIGTPTEWRDSVLSVLREAGFNVGTFGKTYSGAKVRPAKYRDIVARSKIVLGIHREGQMGSFSDRAFRTMACGGFYLCEFSREMDNAYFPHTAYGVWETPENLVSRMNFWLGHGRGHAAEAGRKIVLEKFTWTKFLENVLSHL